jgi:FKBP-type peptidyl-prolyl cis-trans isomerase FkpA
VFTLKNICSVIAATFISAFGFSVHAAAPAVEQPAPAKEQSAAAASVKSETTLPVAPAVVAPKEKIKAADPELSLDSEEQKRSYATGVAMAHYIQGNIERQKALHMTLNRDLLMLGLRDTFSKTLKMSEQDIQATLAAVDEQIAVLSRAEEAKKELADATFVENFARREGAKKTSKGLLYIIDNKGEGDALKDGDTVEITYKGTLTDGTVVYGPQVEGANEVFQVGKMPPVLGDAVKLIRKGGQVTLLLPRGSVKSGDEKVAKSPTETVLIYTVSVINVNKP